MPESRAATTNAMREASRDDRKAENLHNKGDLLLPNGNHSATPRQRFLESKRFVEHAENALAAL